MSCLLLKKEFIFPHEIEHLIGFYYYELSMRQMKLKEVKYFVQNLAANKWS